jgi:hypothetical protein
MSAWFRRLKWTCARCKILHSTRSSGSRESLCSKAGKTKTRWRVVASEWYRCREHTCWESSCKTGPLLSSSWFRRFVQKSILWWGWELSNGPVLHEDSQHVCSLHLYHSDATTLQRVLVFPALLQRLSLDPELRVLWRILHRAHVHFNRRNHADIDLFPHFYSALYRPQPMFQSAICCPTIQTECFQTTSQNFDPTLVHGVLQRLK